MLTHLDGRKIRIKNNPGDVIKPDQLMTVENQGMPFHKKVYNMGNLIIQFKIKFPTSMDKTQVGTITQALGAGHKAAEKPKGEIAETLEMKNFEEYHKNVHAGGGAHGNDSEEEEDDEGHGHGGQRVGCQAQ